MSKGGTMPRRGRLEILCPVPAQWHEFLKELPFSTYSFSFPLLQALESNGAGSSPRWTTTAHERRDSMKSSRLYSCPKTRSTAPKPFQRYIYRSHFFKSPVIETPQFIKVIPSSPSSVSLGSKLNHPCWGLSLLPSTENKIPLFCLSLHRCEIRLFTGPCPYGQHLSDPKLDTITVKTFSKPNWSGEQLATDVLW